MRPAPKVTAFVCVICPRFGDQTCLKFMQVYGDIELPTRQKCMCVQMSTQRKNGEVVRKEKTLATAINNNLTSRTNERIASVKRHAPGAVRGRIRAIPFAQEVAPVSAIC